MTSPRQSPAELAATLAALEVQVEFAQVESKAVTLPDYPDGPRPSGIVRLSGCGSSGLGENVAFLEREQDRFAGFVEAWAKDRGGRRLHVGSALGPGGTPYERAALEAALIDLALRQAKLSLYDLTGVRAAELRFVVSLAAQREPQSMLWDLRAAGFAGELKLDVDPAWTDATLELMASDPRIVIFDFKSRSDVGFARRLRRLNASALFEDPPSGFEAAAPELGPLLISRDAPLYDAQAVRAASARGEAVNLKAPRMGGPLELLRGLEAALALPEDPRISAYFGGMFEVRVGRSQARQLAALYCNTAPNDLALNQPGPANLRESSNVVVRLDRPGFGGQ